jgi:hypothetical protein
MTPQQLVGLSVRLFAFWLALTSIGTISALWNTQLPEGTPKGLGIGMGVAYLIGAAALLNKLARLIHAVHRKGVLCQTNANSYDNHNFPFPSTSEFLKRFASASWHLVAARRNPQKFRLA